MEWLNDPEKPGFYLRGFFLASMVLFLFSWATYGQSIEGKVIGGENKLEIHKVEIRDSLNAVSGFTDNHGNFSLESTGLYHFSKEGYNTKSLYIPAGQLIVVEMTEKPFDLAEVVIKSNQFQSELKDISSSITVVTSNLIKSNDGVNIAPVLNRVPGVYMHNGTLSTNRITIRGIGSRNLFGTSKIRAYYEDIPLTNGSGETTIEDIELEGIARIEVLKGPSSSIYGAGLGGSIQLIADKGPFNTLGVQTSFSFGSFDLRKYMISSNLGNKTNSGKVSYSSTDREGYRQNNELKRQTLTLASNHYLNENNNLNVIGNYIDLKAYIPSSLNEADYIGTPEKAAFTWASSEGHEDYTKFLLGLSWQHQFSQKSKLISSIFGSVLDSYEARPFNILKQNTSAFGLRSRFIQNLLLFEKEFEWTSGIELFNDLNLMKTYENLYQEFPPGTGSVKGDLLSNFEEHRYYVNLFAEGRFHLSKRFLFNFGINLNNTSYRLRDNFNRDFLNFSGTYSFDPILSPKFGLTYQLDKKRMLYASVSHGFSPPKLEETLLPEGQINNDIQPETGWNYEIGSRGKLFNSIFNYGLSLYLMDINDLLVARRTGDDQFFGVNAGKTKHKGLEIELNYFILNKDAIQLSHSNSLSLNDYHFDEFKDLGNDYSGNDLTGVPDKTFFSQLFMNTKLGLYAYVNYQYIGEIPLRDDNSVYTDGYQLVNVKGGYRKKIGDHFHLDAHLGFNNIFNEKYASMLQINAGSFGNNTPRYYYPGEPQNYYAGLSFKYLF